MSPAITPLREERSAEEFVMPVLTLGIRALNDRVLLWTVTVAAGVGWGFTVVHPEPFRILAATLGTVTVLFPFVFRRGD